MKDRRLTNEEKIDLAKNKNQQIARILKQLRTLSVECPFYRDELKSIHLFLKRVNIDLSKEIKKSA